LFASDRFLTVASLFGVMTLVSGPEGLVVAGWILLRPVYHSDNVA
jgi:hypothetical protein